MDLSDDWASMDQSPTEGKEVGKAYSTESFEVTIPKHTLINLALLTMLFCSRAVLLCRIELQNQIIAVRVTLSCQGDSQPVTIMRPLIFKFTQQVSYPAANIIVP